MRMVMAVVIAVLSSFKLNNYYIAAFKKDIQFASS